MIQLSRNYSLPEQERRRSRDQSRRRRRRGRECARSHRARRHGERRNDRDQHRRAIARQFGRDAQGADRPRRSRAASGPAGIRSSDSTPPRNRPTKSARRYRARGWYLSAPDSVAGPAPARRPASRKWRVRAGALVLAFATLPFAFEGKRRAAQAMEALQRIAARFRRGHLFRERPHGRHRCAEGGDSSGLRSRRHHHQPERALDHQCRQTPWA